MQPNSCTKTCLFPHCQLWSLNKLEHNEESLDLNKNTLIQEWRKCTWTSSASLDTHFTLKLWGFCLYLCRFSLSIHTVQSSTWRACGWHATPEHGTIKKVHPQFLCSLCIFPALQLENVQLKRDFLHSINLPVWVFESNLTFRFGGTTSFLPLVSVKLFRNLWVSMEH